MSFRNPDVVLSSSVFRIAVRCLLGFIVVVTLLGSVLGVFARESALADANDEMQSLGKQVVEAYSTGSLKALTALANDSKAQPTDDQNFLSVRRVADGAHIAGANVPAGRVGEAFFHAPDGWDEDEGAWLSTMRLGEDALVTIGVSMEGVYDVEELMQTGFIALLIVGLPLTFVTGYVLSALVLKHLRPLTDGAARIGAGHLDHRINTSGRRDEFDVLSTSFNEMAQSLQTSYRNVRDVSAGVAHNLRTPLTRLRQHLFDALKEADADERLATKLEAAGQEADELVRTFEALLRIGEIEAGHRRAAFRTISLSELAQEVVDSFHPVAEDACGSVTGRIDPGCRLVGDADLIRQLLANLIENAIEHGGADVEVSVALHPSCVLLIVADRGDGVPVGERERVFDRFYRTEAGGKQAGNGLGLSIVKSIVELHRGAVRIEGNAKGGARVLIEFVRPA